MTEAERTRILRKIKACLARADEARNDSESERATALRQANALMDKYAVTMLELGDSEDMGPRGQSETYAGATVWRQDLYFYLAPLYGCKVLNDQGDMLVMGRLHYRNVVIDMGEYIMASIDREAKKHGGGKRVMNNFRRGAVEGVRENIVAIMAERAKRPSGAATGTAMVLVDHYKNELQANTDWMHQHHRVGKGRARSHIGEGGHAGYEAGKGIGLNDQVGGGGRAKERLT